MAGHKTMGDITCFIAYSLCTYFPLIMFTVKRCDFPKFQTSPGRFWEIFCPFATVKLTEQTPAALVR